MKNSNQQKFKTMRKTSPLISDFPFSFLKNVILQWIFQGLMEEQADSNRGTGAAMTGKEEEGSSRNMYKGPTDKAKRGKD